MARVRLLKPTFFTDGDLGALSPLHRLTFQGLWCLADREGRLEDRPRELKIQILPYDDCDFDRLLVDLAARREDRPGIIVRYRVGAQRIIAITNFGKHQKPHPKETASVLPPPPVDGEASSASVPPEPHLYTARPDPGAVEPCKGHGEPGGFFSGSFDGSFEEDSAPEAPAAAAAAEPPPAETPAPVERVVDRPPPPLKSEGRRFFERFQAMRLELHGLVAESAPKKPGLLSGWYAHAKKAVEGDVERLDAGVVSYLRDPFWQAKQFPLAGFMDGTVFAQHVPPKRAQAPPAPACARCARVGGYLPEYFGQVLCLECHDAWIDEVSSVTPVGELEDATRGWVAAPRAQHQFPGRSDRSMSVQPKSSSEGATA